jgi:hypothetical protein
MKNKKGRMPVNSLDFLEILKIIIIIIIGYMIVKALLGVA